MNEAGSLREYVLDTSVALKWFLERDEADVGRARGLREACVAGWCVLRAPEFILIEIANALVRGHRHDARSISEALDAVLGLEIPLEPVRIGTLAHAVRLACARGVNVDDSYFLAMAIESGGTLVTADDAFLRKLGAHPNAMALRHMCLPA